jgi:hypothetical protein
MALKQDERALLQLVCERGQSYEDLAGLLGISEDEVRAKARHALTELGGSDPDAEVPLTDYLLGQADPIGRADAVRHMQQDDDVRELATTISTKLLAIAPNATLPSIPEPRGRKRKAAVSTAPSPAGSGPSASASGPGGSSAGSDGSSRQGRLIAAIAAGAVILLFIILAVAGVFGGDDDSSGGESSPTADATADAEQRDITPVKLDALNGSGVAGEANFGLANDQLFVDLSLDGLDPKIAKGDNYVIWLMLNDNLGYPISQLAPDANGSVDIQIPVPTPVAAAVGANAQSVLVTDTNAKELQDKIDAAVKASSPVLETPGDRLAEGKIPLAQGGQSPAGTGGTGSGADAGAGSASGSGDGG